MHDFWIINIVNKKYLDLSKKELFIITEHIILQYIKLLIFFLIIPSISMD